MRTKKTEKVEIKEVNKLTKMFVAEIKDMQNYYNAEIKYMQNNYNQELTSLRNKNANLSAGLQQQIKSTESVFIDSDKRVRKVAIFCAIFCFICYLMGYFVRGL